MSVIRNVLHKNSLLSHTTLQRSYNSIANLEKKKALRLQEIALDDENCILVDQNDRKIGSSSKRDCHKVIKDDIKLHRAFSVFLFNKDGDMLIQRRSNHKVCKYSIYNKIT